MNSPFKLLDAYTFADREAYFGREVEIEALYQMLLQTPLLLLYGLSGTGKTSLIQCGLANKFEGPDWFPIFIRRQNNVNESLKRALEEAIGEDEELASLNTLAERVNALYVNYLRPVYLIFDQFEELFILGSAEEKAALISSIRGLLQTRLSFKIILTIREEYLGQLYDFEKVIPTLFDFRLRLDPMTNSKVKEVMEKSFEQFNILLEDPAEDRMEEMLDNVSAGKSGVQLPYLQVYLDMLYREDFRRTFNRAREGNELPSLVFTQQEIEGLGKIENVLDKFLQEQESVIQNELSKKYADFPAQAVRQVLDAFVTEEATKRPVRFQYEGEQLKVDEKIQDVLPQLTPDALQACLEALERSRLVRFTSDNIELAHDSLADLIDKQRSDQQRQLNEIKRRIQHSFEEYKKGGHYLSRRQLSSFENYLPQLLLDEEVKAFVENSENQLIAQEQEKLESQRKELKLAQEKLATERRYRLLVTVIAIVAIVAAFFALKLRSTAIDAQERLKNQVVDNYRKSAQALRNEGKYREAIGLLRSSDTLITENAIQQELSALADTLARIASYVQEADTLTKQEQDTLLPQVLLRYQFANQFNTDAFLRNKITQTQAEIEERFSYYKERGLTLLNYDGCDYALPTLRKAYLLNPNDERVNAALRQCQ